MINSLHTKENIFQVIIIINKHLMGQENCNKSRNKTISLHIFPELHNFLHFYTKENIFQFWF